MKNRQSSGTRPNHQTEAGSLEFETGHKSIAISFTDQKLSPHDGSATFWAWLHPRGCRQTLEKALPHPLWDKISCPFANCNAIENRPVFTG